MEPNTSSISRVLLSDQAARDRFCSTHDGNFSVLAPAGVGKTSAIVRRVVSLALGDLQRREPLLPKLVVVTYTRKAAQEMRDRTRNELMRQSNSPVLLELFNRAFWGTIHSFCTELISRYGSRIGLPPHLETVQDDTALWLEFIRQEEDFFKNVPPDYAQALAPFLSNTMFALGREILCQEGLAEEWLPCPKIDSGRLLEFTPSSRNAEKVGQGKELFKNWLKEKATVTAGLQLPIFENGGQAFQEEWQNVFNPLRHWLEKTSLSFARTVAKRFQAFRVFEKQKVTFDDLVGLAYRIVYDSRTADLVRKEGYRVILDEAQDTDREQFLLLLGLVQPSGSQSYKPPPQPGAQKPCPGHFCMVGDPQQSIFSQRADLKTYLGLHQWLKETESAETLTFNVTLRCCRSVVKTLNQAFPKILEGTAGQVSYIALDTPPHSVEGRILRLVLPAPSEIAQTGVDAATRAAAASLATWLRNTSPDQLGVGDWSEVALLCPRNDWLRSLAQALSAQGFLCQIHSHKAIKGDDPAYAWLCALLSIALYPEDAFEVAGVLRELWGVSDHELVCFVKNRIGEKGYRHPLQILLPTEGDGEIPRILNQLHGIRLMAQGLPCRQWAEVWVRETDLKRRLGALPGLSDEKTSLSLQAVLLKLAYWENEQVTNESALESLLEGFQFPMGNEPAKERHLQLYSCHKSKGLEWPVVILPFWFRPILSPHASYPYVSRSNGENQVIWDKYSEAKDYSSAALELQRLLYVAMTRCKHTLVLVDDMVYFQGVSTSQGKSFAELFGAQKDTPNYSLWQQLPTHLERFAAPCAPAASGGPELEFSPRIRPDWSKLLPLASVHDRPVEHIHPSAQTAFNSGDEKEPHSRGVAYGNWWHGMMHRLPWNMLSEWERYFADTLRSCPHPEMGVAEIQLFKRSPLVGKVTQGLDIQTEVYFWYPAGDQCCIEGYIDWVAYDKASGAFLLVDWKTELGEPLALWNHYKPQLEAYRNAWIGLTGVKTESFLYLTSRGELYTL